MSERRSVVGRLHIALTVLLAGLLLALGVLLAANKIEIRLVSQPAASQSQGAPPKGDASASHAGPRFEQVKDSADAFDLLGEKAYCCKFDGAWIDFWIEIDLDGQKTRLAENMGEQLRSSQQVVAGGQLPSQPSGYLLWVRRSEKGKEMWDLAIGLGKDKGAFRHTGISPPQVPEEGGYTEVAEVSDGSLGEGEEVILTTFLRTYEEQGRQHARRATLKCKVLK